VFSDATAGAEVGWSKRLSRAADASTPFTQVLKTGRLRIEPVVEK
jgi:hypothetical protein